MTRIGNPQSKGDNGTIINGYVKEWGTFNPYFLKNPYRKTGNYQQIERWEMHQVLNGKPAFLSQSLCHDEVIEFAKQYNLPCCLKWFSVIVAKNSEALNRVFDAIDKNDKRELGLALGYIDIGIRQGLNIVQKDL